MSLPRSASAPASSAGRRLVEQPERARRKLQPRQRHAPPLAGREHAGGEIGEVGEADALQRRLDVAAVPQAAPVFEVLADGEPNSSGRRGGRGSAPGATSGAASKAIDARGRPEQPRDQAQERRFPRPVPAGDGEEFAGRKRERQPGENRASAADGGKVGGGQAHRQHPVTAKVDSFRRLQRLLLKHSVIWHRIADFTITPPSFSCRPPPVPALFRKKSARPARP